MSRLRMVGIATHSPSHVDFGGQGFLRLMSALRDRGHDVRWVSCGQTIAWLHALAWPTHTARELKGARINDPYRNVAKHVESCRLLLARLADLRPDVLVVDRVNTVCSAVAQQLEVPVVAVGTPGGYWAYSEGGILPQPRAPGGYAELSDILKRRLGWRRADVYSGWLRSHSLNVVFMGRSFYGGAGEAPGRTAFVNVHDDRMGAAEERRSLGIVLGNTGKLGRMRLAIEHLLQTQQLMAGEPIELLAGGRLGSKQLEGLQSLLASHAVTTHGWADYRHMYPHMRRVISFGSIGAVWHAVNHRVPMLLVDGGVGDQRFNCLAIERLGAGVVLLQESDGRDLADAGVRLESAGGTAALRALRHADNYSDSLETAAERVEKTAAR